MASECSIQVFCRIRPLNKIEEGNGSQFIVKFPTDDQISIAGKQFVFDRVFKPNVTQAQVYQHAAAQIVKDVLSGYNGTIFAYGQTSSGKTHTMEGLFDNPENMGIIPRIVQDIFSSIMNMDGEDSDNLEFMIRVSYFEIYNEKIRDLLDETKMNLAIHEDKNRVPYVKNATELYVATPEDVMNAIELGKSNRCVAVTNMNEHSSRSHSVFLIQVKQTHKGKQTSLTGKLYLVDLAGSEKVSKTGAEGQVLEEAKNINKSLSALGNVIAALAEGTKSHVPYRDSKLTRILQESLGGNSRTTVVICCSPASYNEAETKSTLLFGQRAKSIKNVVVVNEELTAEEWKRRYEREKEKVARLRAHLAALVVELMRWRKGEKVPETEWVSLVESTATPSSAGNPGGVMAASMMDSMLGTPSEQLDRSIATAAPLLSSTVGPLSDEERRRYEEERSKIYQQLDEKDDEIQQQSRLNERLKQQIAELEEQLQITRTEHEQADTERQAALQQGEKTETQVKEVLAALEELAINYEAKNSEAEQRAKESEGLQEEVREKQREVLDLTSQLDAIREQAHGQRRRVQDAIAHMFKDLSDLGDGYVAKDMENVNDDELMAHARICISKLSTDYKTTRQKIQDLESGSGAIDQRLETTAKELSECRLQLQQNELKTKTLQETVDKLEKAKRDLEEQTDALREKGAVASNASDAEAAQGQHKQIAQLRDQIAEKSRQVEQLTGELQEASVLRDKLRVDFDQLKQDEQTKERRIRELSALSDKRTQAAQQMKGLQETVDKELATLHNLRKLFVANLAAKISAKQPASTSEQVDEEYTSGAAQRQKIQFLENNLDQLTRVHKQLVRDNADLRCELPKLEKRYRTAQERIKSLEQALRETKEAAMRDRKKYQSEVERIKEAVRQRNLARRGMAAPQIAKPIRPGQPVGGGGGAHQQTSPVVVPVIRPGGGGGGSG